MLRGYLILTLVAILICGCAGMDSGFGAAPSGPGPTAEQIAQWQAASKKGQEEKKKAQEEQDSAQCIEFGYKSGTTDYARCRENLHQKREEAEQATLARQAATQQAAAANQAAIAGAIIAKGPIYAPPPPPQAYQPVPTLKLPRPVTTTCRQDPVLKGNVTCTSQ